MSQTESLGVSDAGRWTGVAASMAEFLQSWLIESQAPLVAPKGIVAGAKRFLNHALEGIALNRRERQQPQIPIMAGLSNLTIALGVFHRLPSPTADLAKIEEELKLFLYLLQQIEGGARPAADLSEQAQALQRFFLELREQGNRARHASFANAEMPQA